MKQKIRLPVDNFERKIVQTVRMHSVTIVDAETGSGKSTRIPLMLIKGLGKPVIVTQPRRLATEALATRVADENNLRLGGFVGYKTAVASNASPNTLCLYVTDGLQLVRELTEAKKTLRNGIILIIDEVHEFNENIETLLAWCDQLIKQDISIKVVIMSATMNSRSLSRYFNDAPIIQIPGKLFPVVGSPSSETGIYQVGKDKLVEEIRNSISAKKNTLVFLPGKNEIAELARELTGFSLDAEIIELHGELSHEDQNRIFDSYEKKKLILATNIAQTSITVPDIDCVIDTGLEKRLELNNGVETLLERCISKADVIQRAGRAGRTKYGIYVLCSDTPYEQFPDYPIPEIQRKRLDQMVLRLATANFDATELRFFHQPNKLVLVEAKQTLIDMEAMEEDGTVTKLGYEINRFPTSVIVARMIIEAIKRKCLGKILTFAAILSNSRSSIKQQWNRYQQRPPDHKLWDQIIPRNKQYKSDLFVEYDLWDLAYQDIHTLEQNGVDRRNYMDSVAIRKQLKSVIFQIGYHAGPEYNENVDDDTEVLKCVAAGMIHNVYMHVKNNQYIGAENRNLSHESCIHRGGYPKLIVGTPMNVSTRNKIPGQPSIITRIVENCTAIEPSWLSEIAPHLVHTKVKPIWSNEQQMLIGRKSIFFNGREIVQGEEEPIEWSEEHVSVLADVLSETYVPAASHHGGWIRELRTTFFKKDLGTTVHFSKKFAQAIAGYRTLLLSDLKVHRQKIQNIVLGEKGTELPEVQDGQFVDTLIAFAARKRGTLTFTMEKKRKSKEDPFRATAILTMQTKVFKATGQFFEREIMAQEEAAKLLYEKLSNVF